jgi:Kef-type K+ transport system membrane component KefB
VNTILLLMGLLLLSYLGSFFGGNGRSAGSVRGVGLPSGVEYVALGFLLGPQALGLVGGDTLGTFEPVVQVALGWLAFALGLDYGYTGDGRVRASSLGLGTLAAVLTGAAAAAAAWVAVAKLDVGARFVDHLLLAGGVGAVCSDTGRQAVRWTLERHGARGPLADRLNELAHADGLVPFVAAAALFALDPTPHVPVRFPLWEWPAMTLALGAALGAGAALLMRSELLQEDTWGVLLGISLIAIGTSARLGLSTLTACFAAGLALSLLSRYGGELRAMVAPTERPVLLPALLLAGARLDLRASSALLWIAAAAVGARLAAKIGVGLLLASGSRSARQAGPLVGLSIVSSGPVAMSIGMVFALRFPGRVGDSVLVVAAVAAAVGEVIGPASLRRALENAGETRSQGLASRTDPREAAA